MFVGFYTDFDLITFKGKTHKPDYFRYEAEKGMLVTRRAPDKTAVRSPSLEDKVASSVSEEKSQRREM